jgi:hypothetical protein
MRPASVVVVWAAIVVFAAGCGLSYQAATEHRAAKMEQELKPGDSMAQVREIFGEPDIEYKPDEQTEVWSYAKHANSNDTFAEMFYTSAKEGDLGTFEDLKFTNGNLISWGEGEHTMEAKDTSGLTTTFTFGKGGHKGGAQSADTSTDSSGSSSSNSGRSSPFGLTF